MAINPIKIATINSTDSIVSPDGRPSNFFLRYLNGTIQSLKSGVNSLIDIQNAVTAANAAAAAANAAAATAQGAADTVAADANLANSYVTGCTLTATDAGANVTVTISAHTRVYGDGTTVAVSGGSVTGLPYSTVERIYYDDPARTGGAVTYQATTSVTVAAQTGDRHSVGAVTTPAALGSPTPGNPVYPPGYAIP